LISRASTGRIKDMNKTYRYILRKYKLWILRDLIKRVCSNLRVLIKMDLAKEYARLSSDVVEIRNSQRDVLSLPEKIAALQAVDIGFRETGKIIIIARVAGRDIVTIVDIKPETTMKEYQRICAEIKENYGARITFVDAPGNSGKLVGWLGND
jgi:hypothetical protein